MHWTTTNFIMWVIEISGAIILIQAIFLLSKVIIKIEDNLKQSLIFILIAFIFYLILGAYVAIAITKEFAFDSYLWIITFVIGLFVALFLVIGGKKLLNEIEKS